MVKHGAALMSKFDPELTTHVVTEYKAPKLTLPQVFQKIGVKDAKEFPKHIPIVCWDWVVKGLSYMKYSRAQMDKIMLNTVDESTFPDRIVYPFGTPKPTRTFASFNFKTRQKPNDDEKPDTDEEPGCVCLYVRPCFLLTVRNTSPSQLNFGNTANVVAGGGHVDMADLFFGTGAAPMSPPASQDPQAGPSDHNKRQEDTDEAPDLNDPLAEYYEEAERIVALADDDGVCIL